MVAFSEISPRDTSNAAQEAISLLARACKTNPDEYWELLDDGLDIHHLYAVHDEADAAIRGAALVALGGEKAYIVAIATSPEVRRQGIGRILLEGIAQRAEEAESHVVEATIALNRGFFDHMGFTRSHTGGMEASTHAVLGMTADNSRS